MIAKIIFLILSITLLANCKSGFFKRLHERNQLKLAPEITKGTLDNGLTYYIMPSSKPAGRCFLRLFVKAGSFAEQNNQRGMAHVVEHMAFNDRAVSKDESLAEWFQKHGMAFGPDANAFTTPDSTVYKIDLPTCDQQTLKDSLAIFRSFADGLDFKEENLIKELSIISAEELNSQNAQSKLSQKIINKLFSGTLYPERPVLGKAEQRSLFTREMLLEFYHQWYEPKNISVVITGDFGQQNVASLISEAFNSFEAKSAHRSQPPGGSLDYKTPIFIISEKDKAEIDVVYSVQSKKITTPRFSYNLLKDRIAFELALTMLRSKYAEQAREHSHIIQQSSLNGFMIDDKIYELSLGTAGSNENFEQNFIDAYRILRQAAEFGFDQQEFKATKDIFLDYLDQAVVAEATWGSDNWANLILNHINNQRIAVSARDYQKLAAPVVNNLEAKDAQHALAQALKSGYEFLFAMGPLEDSPDNNLKLKDLLHKAKHQKIEEAHAKEKVNFAYKIPNCPVLLVPKRKFLAEIDAYKLKISKNLSIIAKRTKFKDDEVLINIFTNEGFMNMPPKELTEARVAQSVLPEGGLLKHSPEQVLSVLKDKFFKMQLAVLDNRIQVTIATRNQDLRFALELLRANILEPAYAQSALDRTRERIKLNYEELKHNIWYPLQNEFPKALSGNDYRVGQEKLENLLAISQEDLLAWHNKYIKNKALNIVIVGDFDLDQVTNDITCVLAPLVQAAPKENNKPPKKLSFKTNIHNIYNVDTDDEASKIVLRYALMYPGAEFPEHQLSILQNIIQEQLRLKLREKRHASYAPSAIINASNNKAIQNWLDIVITAPKNEAAKILQESKKIINNLALKGISKNQFIKAKEPYISHIKNLYNDNNYWLLSLSQDFNRSKNWTSLQQALKKINIIKIENINKLLRTYMLSAKASTAIVHGTKQNKQDPH